MVLKVAGMDSSGLGQVEGCCEHSNRAFDFCKTWGISCLAVELLASEEGLSSMLFVCLFVS
jgi:hypothetical protein